MPLGLCILICCPIGVDGLVSTLYYLCLNVKAIDQQCVFGQSRRIADIPAQPYPKAADVSDRPMGVVKRYKNLNPRWCIDGRLVDSSIAIKDISTTSNLFPKCQHPTNKAL
jgi:hypothetical protein